MGAVCLDGGYRSRFICESIAMFSPCDDCYTLAPWRGQVKMNVSDQTRTVLDMLNDPALGGGIRPTVDVFKSYLKSEQKDTALLISYADRLGNGAIFKRLGFLAERFAKDEKNLIEACRSRLSAGNAKLDTSLPADRLITTWKLWVPEAWAREKTGED